MKLSCGQVVDVMSKAMDFVVTSEILFDEFLTDNIQRDMVLRSITYLLILVTCYDSCPSCVYSN